MAQNAAARILCQAPRRQHHSSRPTKGYPMATCAQKSLQDRRPLVLCVSTIFVVD